jgi:hypothetical protein
METVAVPLRATETVGVLGSSEGMESVALFDPAVTGEYIT